MKLFKVIMGLLTVLYVLMFVKSIADMVIAFQLNSVFGFFYSLLLAVIAALVIAYNIYFFLDKEK